MNVVPGNSFIRPNPGPAGQTAVPRPATTNAALHAQAAGTEGAAKQAESPTRPAPAPFGPRGSLIDILA